MRSLLETSEKHIVRPLSGIFSLSRSFPRSVVISLFILLDVCQAWGVNSVNFDSGFYLREFGPWI